MDRSWITKGVRKLSSEHIKGVEEFMQCVRRNFAKDDRILCPCSQCLNRKDVADQGRVQDHLLLNGMASTYDRWIHHGEPMEGGPQHVEAEAQPPHGSDDGIAFMENVLQGNDNLEEEDT